MNTYYANIFENTHCRIDWHQSAQNLILENVTYVLVFVYVFFSRQITILKTLIA